MNNATTYSNRKIEPFDIEMLTFVIDGLPKIDDSEIIDHVEMCFRQWVLLRELVSVSIDNVARYLTGDIKVVVKKNLHKVHFYMRNGDVKKISIYRKAEKTSNSNLTGSQE